MNIKFKITVTKTKEYIFLNGKINELCSIKLGYTCVFLCFSLILIFCGVISDQLELTGKLTQKT